MVAVAANPIVKSTDGVPLKVRLQQVERKRKLRAVA